MAALLATAQILVLLHYDIVQLRGDAPYFAQILVAPVSRRGDQANPTVGVDVPGEVDEAADRRGIVRVVHQHSPVLDANQIETARRQRRRREEGQQPRADVVIAHALHVSSGDGSENVLLLKSCRAPHHQWHLSHRGDRDAQPAAPDDEGIVFYSRADAVAGEMGLELFALAFGSGRE